jgi:hypothetical protein
MLKFLLMKMIFFLVAFSLVSIRVYFSWAGLEREKRGESTSDMVIKSDNFYEEIKYSGKFQLTDDETTFKSISPGGYFKYRRNEVIVKAESNLKGEIEYSIYDGQKKVKPDGEGKKLVAEAVHAMIVQGFDAKARMERIYQQGGKPALLREVDSMRFDPMKILYLNRLFELDSLSPEDLQLISKKIGSLGSDGDKNQLLKKFTTAQLQNQQTAVAYFLIVGGMGADMEKINAIQHYLETDSVTGENKKMVLAISSRLSGDMDKGSLYRQMIAKGMASGPFFDSLLNKISLMGSDLDKSNIYRNLMDSKDMSEEQWIQLLNKISNLESDLDKTNLLIDIAAKMPRTGRVKAAYDKSARSIHDDYNYGRAIRALG